MKKFIIKLAKESSFFNKENKLKALYKRKDITPEMKKAQKKPTEEKICKNFS